MPEHTHGPWIVRTCKGHGLDQIDAAADGFTIADVEAISFASVGGYAEYPADPMQRKAKPGEVEANARLIAAAPDLLAACKLLLESPVAIMCLCDHDKSVEVLTAVRKAVVKAEGQA